VNDVQLKPFKLGDLLNKVKELVASRG